MWWKWPAFPQALRSDPLGSGIGQWCLLSKMKSVCKMSKAHGLPHRFLTHRTAWKESKAPAKIACEEDSEAQSLWRQPWCSIQVCQEAQTAFSS